MRLSPSADKTLLEVAPRHELRPAGVKLIESAVEFDSLRLSQADVSRRPAEAVPQVADEAKALIRVQGVDVDRWHAHGEDDTPDCRRTDSDTRAANVLGMSGAHAHRDQCSERRPLDALVSRTLPVSLARQRAPWPSG
jgi:hypothetical protein